MRTAQGEGIWKRRGDAHLVDKTSSPPLLSILRSRQQVELLALVLGEPERELSVTDLATRRRVREPADVADPERTGSVSPLKARVPSDGRRSSQR